MKRLFPAILAALLFTSCKKEHTCICTRTDNDSDDGVSWSGNTNYELGKQKSFEAHQSCENYEENTHAYMNSCSIFLEE